MNFPKQLNVTVLEKGTRKPIDNLAIILELFANRKNNYFFGPLISDISGRVQFTREECERSIKTDQEMFIMDYVDTLEECKPRLEVRLHATEHIEGMLKQYKMSPAFWGKRFRDADQIYSALQCVRNAFFKPAGVSASEPQLLKDPNLGNYALDVGTSTGSITVRNGA